MIRITEADRSYVVTGLNSSLNERTVNPLKIEYVEYLGSSAHVKVHGYVVDAAGRVTARDSIVRAHVSGVNTVGYPDAPQWVLDILP
jgi:hypothetical protein